MDFNDTPKEAEFREKVRTFLDQNVEKRSTNLKTVQLMSVTQHDNIQSLPLYVIIP